MQNLNNLLGLSQFCRKMLMHIAILRARQELSSNRYFVAHKRKFIANNQSMISSGEVKYDERRRTQFRMHAQADRRKHLHEYRSYQRDYQKEYLKDPNNYLAHIIRSKLNRILNFWNILPSTERKYGVKRQVLLEKMEHARLNFNSDKFTLDHIIPLSCLIDFGLNTISDIPILNYHENIQYVPKNYNHVKYCYIDQFGLRLAQTMEQMFPNKCAGLYDWCTKWNEKKMLERLGEFNG